MGFYLSVYNATTIFMILPLFTLGTMHRAPTSESLFSSGNTLLPASVIPMKMGIYSLLSSLGVCNAPFYG